MHRTRYVTLLPALAALISAAPAFADTVLQAPELSALISDNTLYVEVPAGAPGAPEGGIAPIFYAKDGTVAAQLPAGPKLTGTWTLDGAQYCIDWTGGPQNSCSQLLRGEKGFVIMDVAANAPRGLVTQIATGNPENL